MKSITIHGVDKQLTDLIKSKAESEGLSINKTIKKLLETSLGVKPQVEKKNLKDYCLRPSINKGLTLVILKPLFILSEDRGNCRLEITNRSTL